MSEARRPLPDLALGTAATGAALFASGLLVWLLCKLVMTGGADWSWGFLFEQVQGAGRSGGIGPILVSTVLILSVCLAFAMPIGLLTAAFLAERRGGRLERTIRLSLDCLSGVPSIVFGLFGNAFFCQFLGLGFSILSGGLTLACMVLPLLIRSAEQSLRAVPIELDQAAHALSISRHGRLFGVLLPVAAPGIAAGLILAVGRAAAETAALLFTSGYVDRMPDSLMRSGRSLSIHVYDLAMNVPGGDQNAARSALVLVVLLLFVNRVIAWRLRRS